jgi:hypothetical protein
LSVVKSSACRGLKCRRFGATASEILIKSADLPDDRGADPPQFGESLRTGHRAKSRPISFPGETIMATTGPTAAIEVAAIEDTSLLAFYRDMNAAERHTFWACASYGR